MVLTTKDVTAGGFRGVIVLSKHTGQSPDNHRVDRDDESHVLIEHSVFQDKPAKR